jgi:hypothetical protein
MHACECDYVMKSRKGAKKNRPQEPKSDSDTLASSDDGVVISPGGQRTIKTQVGGLVVAAPSFHVLPTSQLRLLHHMASIAQSIETGRAGNLVIYLKRLPT